MFNNISAIRQEGSVITMCFSVISVYMFPVRGLLVEALAGDSSKDYQLHSVETA